jgi:hypothetical protein
MVERNLSSLYNDCVTHATGPTSNLGIHIAVFDAVISLDARISMIRAAIQWKATSSGDKSNPLSSFVDEWNVLAKAIRKRYTKRNEIAHSDIVQWGDKAGKIVVNLAPFPTFSNSLDNRLSLKELAERQRSFVVIAQRIDDFTRRIRSAQGSTRSNSSSSGREEA